MTTSLMHLEETELVAEIAAGSSPALAEAYRRHAGPVYGLALRLLRDATLAEDITQEVFLRLWNRPRKFDPTRGTLRAFLLTHVPPFREAAVYRGRPSDEDWAPHFSCKAMGDLLIEVMADHPTRKLTVLCGHTHGGGESKILPNLLVLTGQAKYRHPAIQRIFEWG